jgi:hypothetical protein
MRRRFDSSCWLQPLKHCRRCSRPVSGRTGFDSSQGHQASLRAKRSIQGPQTPTLDCFVAPPGLLAMTMRGQALIAALAHSVERRGGISEARGSKPRRSTNTTDNVPVAQSAEALLSEGRRWGFESSSGHHFALAYANRQSGLAQTQLFGDSTSPASTSFFNDPPQ